MGGISLQKIKTTSEMHSILSHINRHDQTIKGQEVDYKNKYIRRENLGQNYTLGGFPSNTSTHYNKLKKRLFFIDKQQPPARVRSDRVLFVSYVVTAPEDLPNEQQEDFFKMVYNELSEFSGGSANLSAGFVHNDEIHDYIDPLDDMQKTSRPHMHVIGLPYTKEKGINCRSFLTRARLRQINKNIEENTLKRFGVHFNTGRTVSGLTVEQLQQKSEQRAIELGLKEYIDNLNTKQDMKKIIEDYTIIEKYKKMKKYFPEELEELERKTHDKNLTLLENITK